MSELFKSKVGMLLAGIHLLTVLSCLMYRHLIDESSLLPLLISIILSSPWYFLLFYFLIPLVMGGVGELGSKDFILIGVGAMVIGALINAYILYFLGFLLTKAFNYLSQQNQSLS
jgi:hypothetical protein